jgi:hypothetical protein
MNARQVLAHRDALSALTLRVADVGWAVAFAGAAVWTRRARAAPVGTDSTATERGCADCGGLDDVRFVPREQVPPLPLCIRCLVAIFYGDGLRAVVPDRCLTDAGIDVGTSGRNRQ